MDYINVISNTRKKIEDDFDPDMAKELLKLTLSALRLDMLIRLKNNSDNKVNPMLLRETNLLLESLSNKEGVFTREYVSCKDIVKNNYHIIKGV